jgi:hypothetical protein
MLLKLLFLEKSACELADDESFILSRTKTALLATGKVEEVFSPDAADAIIIQEKNSFKNFHYVNDLLNDPFISRYANKIFTINDDDCATGLLRGLYTSLPKHRFDKKLHVAVPYMQFPNNLVFTLSSDSTPRLTATWRGNTKSNHLRKKLINVLGKQPDILLETTDSWLNHSDNEKEDYVNIILNGRLSLCPAGWAPVSFRIYESMALGRCPVILADAFVPPLGPNWNSFALFFPENKIKTLYGFLQQKRNYYQELGLNAKRSWDHHFSAGKIASYYASSLLTIIASASLTSNKDEFKRWNSNRLYWTNNWTLPQRILNKARQISAKQLA